MRTALLAALPLLTNAIAQPQTFKVLYTFTGTSDGSSPRYLYLDGGHLLGTTLDGGSAAGQAGNGTIFQLDIPTRQLTVLHTFAGEPTDGSQAVTTLVRGPSGDYYGITYTGGSMGGGTVFQMDPAGAVTLLHSFRQTRDEWPNGEGPLVGLALDSSGDLYGGTMAGGADDCGTVFKLHPGGSLTTLYNLTCQPDGRAAVATLLLQGSLYGVSPYGGASNFGDVFAVDTNTGEETILHGFGGSDGAEPNGGLIGDGAGNIYGTTTGGGAGGKGVVFEINIATGTYTVLHAFEGPEGANPVAGLIRDQEDNLYGTTVQGGAHTHAGFACTQGCGAVFELTAAGSLIVIHSFAGGAGGASPYGSLVADGEGHIYGATAIGGLVGGCYSGAGCGTIFEIALAAGGQ